MPVFFVEQKEFSRERTEPFLNLSHNSFELIKRILEKDWEGFGAIDPEESQRIVQELNNVSLSDICFFAKDIKKTFLLLLKVKRVFEDAVRKNLTVFWS